MKWFKLCCWLAAWGVWLWCGFGLHHQLPRAIGPIVARVPTGGGYSPLGFVGDTNSIAVLVPPEDRFVRKKVQLFDAESGETVGEQLGPQAWVDPNLTHDALRHGVLIGRGNPDRANRTRDEGLRLLDLLKGTWLTLWPEDLVIDIAFHPQKPWVAATAGHARDLPYKLAVFDLRSGKRVFERILDRPETYSGKPLFIVERNEILLPISRRGGIQAGSATSIEIWRIDGDCSKAAVWEVPFYRGASVSGNGRLLFDGRLERTDAGASAWNDVLDIGDGRFISSVPAEERTLEVLRRRNAHFPVISVDGGTILRGDPAALYEVGSGAKLWRAGPQEELAAPTSQNVFLVAEHWGNIWQSWFPSFQLESRAVRSRTTGDLLYRTPGDVVVMPFNSNISRSLALLSDGSVHRLPLPVNYPILALCQTILALPIVLLWALLWYRRRRAARRQPAVANLNA